MIPSPAGSVPANRSPPCSLASFAALIAALLGILRLPFEILGFRPRPTAESVAAAALDVAQAQPIAPASEVRADLHPVAELVPTARPRAALHAPAPRPAGPASDASCHMDRRPVLDAARARDRLPERAAPAPHQRRPRRLFGGRSLPPPGHLARARPPRREQGRYGRNRRSEPHDGSYGGAGGVGLHAAVLLPTLINPPSPHQARRIPLAGFFMGGSRSP